jgi:hypothetical protein
MSKGPSFTRAKVFKRKSGCISAFFRLFDDVRNSDTDAPDEDT